MAQAHWNLEVLGADPTDNLQTHDVYLNDGTLTASGVAGFRRRNEDGVWSDVGATAGGGSSLPVVDTTSLVEDPGDATKEMRIDVGAVATGTVRVLAMPNADVTLPAVPVGTTDAQALTNKTIDADSNTVSNIGSAEIKAEIITGLAADASPDGAVDFVMTHDNSAGALKKVLLDNLPGGGASISFAILRDEKATTVAGGGCSAATWNARDLNTEVSDTDSIVSIASDEFTPISGDYLIHIAAATHDSGGHRMRLYNVTGASSVKEGLNAKATPASSFSTMAYLTHAFTANGTDAYRIDHYTASATPANGMGDPISDGSNEVYMEILLEKVA